jgi:hypothetical protein
MGTSKLEWLLTRMSGPASQDPSGWTLTNDFPWRWHHTNGTGFGCARQAADRALKFEISRKSERGR